MSIKVGDKDLFPYLGDYRPVNIYKGEHKVAGWKWTEQSGKELLFKNTYNDFVEVEVDGKSYQDGAPTPDHPIEIHSLNGFDVVSSTEKLSEGKLEEYDYDTEYDNVDKINLSLSEPLRSVGDVKDRLFRDSDGLWKVERNVGEEVFENGEKWSNSYWYEQDNSVMYGTLSEDTSYMKRNGAVNFSHVPTGATANNDINAGALRTNPRVRLRLRHEIIGATEPSPSLFKEWLKKEYDNGTPLTIVYEKTESTIEILDQELQDKLNNLRSFQGSNYIYTMVENLKPTLHARLKVKDI